MGTVRRRRPDDRSHLAPRYPGRSRRRRALPTAAALTLLTLVATAATAAAAAPVTKRVSVSTVGTQGDDLSGNAGRNQAVSGNGRWVAFFSEATNLVPGSTPGQWEVLLRDVATGTTSRPVVSTAGVPGDDWSYGPALSTDGRYLAFTSYATNLVDGDTNAMPDVFVRDRVAGTTERVSLTRTGGESGGASSGASISGNGSVVAFESAAPDLLPSGAGGVQQVYVRNRATGTTRPVSVSSSGVPGNGPSSRPTVSANGRFVVFESEATDLVPGDTNASCTVREGCTSDVFVRDLWTRTTTRVSLTGRGTQAPRGGSQASISADGRYVAFLGDGLVAADTTPGVLDVYVRDTVRGTTRLVSRSSSGAQASLPSETPEISDDGRFVAFASAAPDLVPGDTNGETDVFLRDLTTGLTVRTSVRSSGAQGDRFSSDPDVSADGSRVVFVSWATNLVRGDTNDVLDVFLWQR